MFFEELPPKWFYEEEVQFSSLKGKLLGGRWGKNEDRVGNFSGTSITIMTIRI